MKEKEEKGNWKYEIARDNIAIGGLLFYIMFIARALIAPYYTYALQLTISLIIAQSLLLVIKKSEANIARGFIAAIFTILFYNVKTFTIFATFVYLAIIGSAVYLRKTKQQIIRGLFIGIISAGIGYHLIELII